MTAYWATQAWLPAGVTERVRLEVDGGRITAVRTGVAARPGDRVLDGLLLPGLANGHSHAFHHALRGRTQADGGTFWTWREQMYAVAARLDPDAYLELATAVYAEMALAGYTVVGEFHYLHHGRGGRPYADPNAMGAALVEAAARAGVRLTLLDTCYLRGGLDADGYRPLDAVQEQFGDGTVDGWAERWGRLRSVETETARVGGAIHSVRAVPAADLATVARTVGSRSDGAPLHVHVSEQPAENEACRAQHGCSPAELLAAHGVLGPRTTAVHATHLTDHDITLLGESGTTCCVCPTTERDLADGIGPAHALLAAGSPLSVGSDQNAVVDPFEEVRGLELHERLSSRRRGRFTPDQLLAAGTRAGYASLGWPEGGALAVGALADFVAVRTGTVRTVGSRPEQILHAAGAPDVNAVVVAGRVVVEDGEHRLGPVAGMLGRALAQLDVA
ncbi:MAG TPA: formimidoylglutamate deiminase [Friedmanniella sp.]